MSPCHLLGLTSAVERGWSLVPGPEHSLVVWVNLGGELHPHPGRHVGGAQAVVGVTHVDAGVVLAGLTETENGVESVWACRLIGDSDIGEFPRQEPHFPLS